MTNGRLNDVYTRPSPASELSKRASRIMRNSGTMVTIGGSMRVERIQKLIFEPHSPGQRKRANAYAAGVPSVSASSVEAAATRLELRRNRPNERTRNASR